MEIVLNSIDCIVSRIVRRYSMNGVTTIQCFKERMCVYVCPMTRNEKKGNTSNCKPKIYI